MTDEEFKETWHGIPNTIKIGVLLPFSPENDTSYRRTYARVSLSVCVIRMEASHSETDIAFQVCDDHSPFHSLFPFRSFEWLLGI
jgi:hypothetical protein